MSLKPCPIHRWVVPDCVACRALDSHGPVTAPKDVRIHRVAAPDCAACDPPVIALDAHGPVMAREDIVPGKWYLRELALPPQGLYVLCTHNRGTWRSAQDQKGVVMVVLYRVDNKPGADVCENNRGAGYDWLQFGVDKFFGHSIDRWMRPLEID